MPSINDHDALILQTIERWKLTAASEVDAIGVWRDADPSSRHHRYWPTAQMPEHFYGETATLVGIITSEFPKLDPMPLQDIYAAVSAWYEDKNTSRIPSQNTLYATLERTMTILQAMEYSITHKPIDAGNPADAGSRGNGDRRHSDDFTSVMWDGQNYQFTKGNQAESVRVLWESWRNGTPTLSEKTIGEMIGSSNERFRLADTFRKHPAWGRFVIEASKGVYRLADPAASDTKNPES